MLKGPGDPGPLSFRALESASLCLQASQALQPGVSRLFINPV
jgi:hypothetical protein